MALAGKGLIDDGLDSRELGNGLDWLVGCVGRVHRGC